MLRRLIKNKRGSQLLETVILFPLIMYIIMISVFRIMVNVEQSAADKQAMQYSRILDISPDLYSGLDALARAEMGNNFKITEITVGEYTMAFSYETRAQRFDAFITENAGNVGIDKVSLLTAQPALAVMSSEFGKGVKTKITVTNDLRDSLPTWFNLSYTDPFEHKTYEVTFGIDSKVESSFAGTIYHKI